MNNTFTNFFEIMFGCFIWGTIFLISTPFYYFLIKSDELNFFIIPRYLRLSFFIIYILLYIRISRKYKKYLIIFFIILYLYFAFFIVPNYFNNSELHF